ncbi:O-acyltransferase like protein-like [Zerene cesonia]|uniref:O-acyltransferase like protein-like n=1 Tax=Zerene cesonia TaxID=33412 RepID=UPI0018E51719|nr:O-acyltransferase like protein-like [Zerene cesonia]
MDNLFVVYDPSFLALVWPKIKNGVHLSLDRYCWTELSVFFRDYLDGHAWAYKTADASGRYSASFFTGNKFWLGSKQQCQMLNDAYESHEQDETWGEFYNRDYLKTLLKGDTNFGRNQQDWHALVQRDELVRRLVRADNAPPFTLAYSVLQLQLNLTSLALAKSYDVTLGVCLPRSCASEDIVSIINFSIMLNDHLKYNNSLTRSIKITSIREIQGYDIKDDVVAVLTILITITFILLSVIATLVDLDVFALKHQTLNLNKPNNNVETTKTITRPVIVDAVMKNANNAGTLKLCDAKLPPSITLGVVNMEGTGNCRRCGKYRKQCAISRQFDNFPPCPRMKFNSCASSNAEIKKTNGLVKDLLLSFSIKHSWMRVFNTNMANKDLAVIHAVKIVATFWIIFIHVAVAVSYVSNSGDVNDPGNMYYNIMATGTLAFDALFFVSGIFSAHHFFYLKGRYSSEEVLRCSGPCGQLSQLICFIINRAIRLLPPYVFAIFISSVASRAGRSGSALGGGAPDTCHQHWWRNLLYVTNLYPREEQCMQVSWYLSSEAQLHAGGAALSAALAARERPALALAALLLLAAPALDLLTPRGTLLREGYAWEGHVWSHAAPYLLGVLTGWLVHRIDGLLTVPKMWSISLWVWSFCAALGSCALPWVEVWGAWGAGAAGAAGGAGAEWVTAWLHLLWPAAGIWPAVVCSTKYAYRTRQLLDSRAWCGASRLCYGALLLHGAAASALLAADTALCASFSCLLCYYLGVTAATLGGAFCLCVLVEMPTCSFLTRLSDYVYR